MLGGFNQKFADFTCQRVHLQNPSCVSFIQTAYPHFDNAPCHHLFHCKLKIIGCHSFPVKIFQLTVNKAAQGISVFV